MSEAVFVRLSFSEPKGWYNNILKVLADRIDGGAKVAKKLMHTLSSPALIKEGTCCLNKVQYMFMPKSLLDALVEDGYGPDGQLGIRFALFDMSKVKDPSDDVAGLFVRFDTVDKEGPKARRSRGVVRYQLDRLLKAYTKLKVIPEGSWHIKCKQNKQTGEVDDGSQGMTIFFNRDMVSTEAIKTISSALYNASVQEVVEYEHEGRKRVDHIHHQYRLTARWYTPRETC